MFRFPLFLSLLLILAAGCSKNQLPFASGKSFDMPVGDEISNTQNTDSKQPAGYVPADQEFYASDEILMSEFDGLNEKASLLTANENSLIKVLQIKEEKDSTEIKPVFEPFVLGGSATAVAGAAIGLIGLTAGPVLILLGAALLIVSAILTMIGWKRIKKDPKKYKGEKLAVANYIIIGVLGVAASFYLIYLLFTF